MSNGQTTTTTTLAPLNPDTLLSLLSTTHNTPLTDTISSSMVRAGYLMRDKG
jgi:hypothetical protein